MVSAFSDSADFSAMSPEHLMITDVLQEVYVAVDEKGTEAAAATAVVVGETSAPSAEPVTLTVDRPFLFWIVDAPTKAVLFLGRVLDPTA
jgi:serpin B